jgi:hypothetical protein
MSNLICKENFNWKKYVDRYKDLKSIDNLDNAWNHWCEDGRKQGRKFYTLAPYKNNKFYIITKEYIKQKNLKLKNTKSIVVSGLDDDNVIEDFVSNIKHKLKKLNKNNKFICQTVNQNVDDKLIKKQENKLNINSENKLNINSENKLNIKNENKLKNEKNNQLNKHEINKEKSNKIKDDDIEILEKDIKYTESKINNKRLKEEWTLRSENSEIFFLDFDKNKEDSDESKIYFSKKNPLNVFSNST